VRDTCASVCITAPAYVEERYVARIFNEIVIAEFPLTAILYNSKGKVVLVLN
jgi:hypothetical protein